MQMQIFNLVIYGSSFLFIVNVKHCCVWNWKARRKAWCSSL